MEVRANSLSSLTTEKAIASDRHSPTLADSLNTSSSQTLQLLNNASSNLEKTLNQAALSVFQETNQASNRLQRYLNTGANNLFKATKNQIDKYSKTLNDKAEYTGKFLADYGRRFQEVVEPNSYKAVKTISTGAGIISDIEQTIGSISGSTISPLTKTGFGLLNAVTGVTSSLAQYSTDYDRGDNNFSRTMMRSTATTAQTLASSYAVAALLAGTTAALAPATVAMGAAIGIGYLANHLIAR